MLAWARLVCLLTLGRPGRATPPPPHQAQAQEGHAPTTPDRQLKHPAGSVSPHRRADPHSPHPARCPRPWALRGARGRHGCSRPGNGAPRAPTRPHPRPPSAHGPEPGARGRPASPCSFREVMSCSCFSSSELFMPAGGVGAEEDSRQRRGARRGRGQEKRGAGGVRLPYPEVGLGPAPPPPGAERTGEIIRAHLVGRPSRFTCGQAGRTAARRGAGGGAGGGAGRAPRWARPQPPPRPRDRGGSSAFSAEAGAAGCAGVRGLRGLRNLRASAGVRALPRSCTPFSAHPPFPGTPQRWIQNKTRPGSRASVGTPLHTLRQGGSPRASPVARAPAQFPPGGLRGGGQGQAQGVGVGVRFAPGKADGD